MIYCQKCFSRHKLQFLQLAMA